MFSTVFSLHPIQKAARLRKILLLGVIVVALALMAESGSAQQSQGSQSGASQQQQNPNQQEAPPEAGGPNGEVGPYGITAPAPSAVQAQEDRRHAGLLHPRGCALGDGAGDGYDQRRPVHSESEATEFSDL